MEKDWIKIYASASMADIELKRAMLDSNGIQSVVINHQDSVYNWLGEIDLYVNRDDVIRAQYTITKK